MFSTIKAKLRQLVDYVKSKVTRVEYVYLISEEVVQDLRKHTPVVMYKPGDRAPELADLAFYHGQLKAIENLEAKLRKRGE